MLAVSLFLMISGGAVGVIVFVVLEETGTLVSGRTDIAVPLCLVMVGPVVQ
jgi:hypothetical protein